MRMCLECGPMGFGRRISVLVVESVGKMRIQRLTSLNGYET
jgi:hypothetical protein